MNEEQEGPQVLSQDTQIWGLRLLELTPCTYAHPHTMWEVYMRLARPCLPQLKTTGLLCSRLPPRARRGRESWSCFQTLQTLPMKALSVFQTKLSSGTTELCTLDQGEQDRSEKSPFCMDIIWKEEVKMLEKTLIWTTEPLGPRTLLFRLRLTFP